MLIDKVIYKMTKESHNYLVYLSRLGLLAMKFISWWVEKPTDKLSVAQVDTNGITPIHTSCTLRVNTELFPWQ